LTADLAEAGLLKPAMPESLHEYDSARGDSGGIPLSGLYLGVFQLNGFSGV